jgi:hypothetical protein
MPLVDLQKIIEDKVRFHVAIDIRVGGYVEGNEPKTETVAAIHMSDLTKEESEMVIKNVVEVLDWVSHKLEPFGSEEGEGDPPPIRTRDTLDDTGKQITIVERFNAETQQYEEEDAY